MPSNDERGISSMELEVETLDKLMSALLYPESFYRECDEAERAGKPYPLSAVEHINGLTARLINRGHPAGYVVNEHGTFMVSVEKVSNATLAAYGQDQG